MKDLLKGAGITLVGVAFFAGLASERARYSARRDLERAIPNSRFHVSVKPRGLLGMAVGRADSARIQGQGFAVDDLPFRVEPRGGVIARLERLKLDFRDIRIRALPVQALQAEIPRVDVDAARVLINGHFTIRGADAGVGWAVITEDGLREFIARKRPEFSELSVRLLPGEALVTGRATLLLAPAPIEARVKLGAADGRFLNAVGADVKVNGMPVPPPLTERLMQSLNPIIDVQRDLGLADWLYVTGVEVAEGILTVRARVTIPRKRVLPAEKKP